MILIFISIILTKEIQKSFVTDYPKRIWLSSIVLMELYAGAFSNADIALIDNIRKPFEARRMMLTPALADYILAGKILAELQKEKGYELKKQYTITNDVLLAISARRLGAVLLTQNKRDMIAINSLVDFDLEIIE